MDLVELTYSGVTDSNVSLPFNMGYAKVSEYKNLKFCIKCDVGAIAVFKWSWDGKNHGLDQKIQILGGRWETIKLDVLMSYICVEIVLASPAAPMLIVTCRAEGGLAGKKRISFGIPPPFFPHSPRVVPQPPDEKIEAYPAVEDSDVSEPMQIDGPQPIKSPKKFRPWARHAKSKPIEKPHRDDRIPGLLSKGCLLYGGGPNHLVVIPPGEEGDILMMVKGTPTWVKQ